MGTGRRKQDKTRRRAVFDFSNPPFLRITLGGVLFIFVFVVLLRLYLVLFCPLNNYHRVACSELHVG